MAEPSSLTDLATDLKAFTEGLRLPRSGVLELLGELQRRGLLHLPRPETNPVEPAAVTAALALAGLRVVRADLMFQPTVASV